ncbi:hypothetical protein AAG906_031262 [Vitis piasezkii]
MKDLGLTDVILGIRVKKNHEGYVLTQSHYVESVLKRFGHYDSKPYSVSQLVYSRVIGSRCTLQIVLDRYYLFVNRLARYTNNLAKEHWFALVRVLRYLKHTIKYGLHYISLESKSTSGYIFTLGGATISWKSSKQTCIARSTMELDFIALDIRRGSEWLQIFWKTFHCLFHHHPNTNPMHSGILLCGCSYLGSSHHRNPSIGSGTLMKKPPLMSPTCISHPWTIPHPTSSFSSQFVLISFNHSISIKLYQNNFLIWGQQVEAAIKGYKLSKFINGIDTPPPKFLSSTDETSVYWLLSLMFEGLLTRMEKLEVFFVAQTRAKID